MKTTFGRLARRQDDAMARREKIRIDFIGREINK
jgi:hypothetical protein